MDTPVSDFYRGKTIFITGATGFIGKVLMEKLLYSCSDLKKIFILARPKRGKSVSARMEDMRNLPMFERLRKEKPEMFEKIIALNGDILSENFGLKPSNIEQLSQEVNIVFHCAATLKLEAQFKDAIEMNTVGTLKILKLCKKMPNLELLVHLSTAFCYADFEVLDEEVHDGADNPHEVMRVCEWMSNDALNALSTKLLKFHPNTYTYSKRLAECLVRDEYPNLPAVIVRPSIVIPAWEEPVEGWVDSLNGPMGIMLGAGKGVIRTMHCDGEAKAEIIPVDYLSKSLIILTQQNATSKIKSPKIPVYNITNNDLKTTTWKEVLELSKKTAHEYPFDYPLWYPDGDIHKNKYIHEINVILFHWIPAILIDFLLLIFRQKRFMMRIQTRISLGLELLQFFTTRQWVFINDNYKKMTKSLTAKEKESFNLDIDAVKDEEYMKRCILGGRVYCMKEPLSSLPTARRINRLMYFLDRGLKIFLFSYLFWYIYSCIEPYKLENPSALPIKNKAY